MTARPFHPRHGAALLAALLALSLPAAAVAATITIVNVDGPGEGFNDPTAVAPVGGNPGTTRGAQRLNVFQHAADIWGALLPSAVEIRVRAAFDPLFCTANSAVLGSAGTVTVSRDFAGAEFAGTWYHQALANKQAGVDLSPGSDDISATFNSDVDNSTCLGTRSWYYGFDGNEGTDIELLPVVLHEVGHGLGFSDFVNESSGALLGGFPDIFSRFILDNSVGLHWHQMNDGQRMASAVNTGNLVWDGPAVTFRAPLVLAPAGRLVVNSPPSIAGAMPMGRADFGAPLPDPGLTRDVILADDGSGTTSDGCQPFVNGAQVNGKLALVDRTSNCSALTQAFNAQSAGAAGVLVIDNVASPLPPTLGGTTSVITIPVGGLRQADGNAIRAELGGGVNATMGVDPAQRSGADPTDRVLLFAPNPLQPGSSIAHWDVSTSPNLLMEPALTQSVSDEVDLTREHFEDIGWLPRVTGVGEAPVAAGRLRGNAPNPFGPSTTLHFELERAGAGELAVYDVSGRLVRRLAQGWFEAGPHALAWDGTDDQGRRLAPGLYLYRLKAGSLAGTRRMVMLE